MGIIALTLYYNKVASTTLSGAGALASATGGTLGNTPTTIGTTNTGYSELASINAQTWAAAAGLGVPSGNGFLWDVTTLEGQQLAAGTWTPSVRLQVSGTGVTGTLVGHIFVRVYRYSSGGTYTLLGILDSGSVTLTTTVTTFSSGWTGNSLGTMTFVSGEKLYTDVWFNCTTNSTTGGITTIKLFAASTSGTGVATAQIVTPGYQTASYRDLATRVLIGTARHLTTRVLIGTARDLVARVRLGEARDLVARVRLQGRATRDLEARIRVQGTGLRDLALRARTQGLSSPRDLALRVLLAGPMQRDLALRVILHAMATPALRDLALRLRIQRNSSEGILLTPLPVYPGAPMPGLTLPLARPLTGSYGVNGVALAEQPAVCTAPFVMGTRVLAGSVFSLQWNSPSGATQAALPSGQVVSLTFALYPGSFVTGQVLLSTQLSGSTFTVSCTVQQTIALNVWRVAAQSL